MKAFEYFRLHARAFHTSSNINSIFYGTPNNLLDDESHSFRHLKNNGYIIGMFADECNIDVVDSDMNLNYSEPFVQYDHLSSSLP